MSLGFNLNSSKKEDVSARLKVHDLKRAKNETKRLETEGRKMEERLMELKLAMNREKEEREKHGGGFWKKGQQGTLNNYAEEVLAKKKSKSASKPKIKILKDKPLDLPERSNQPGTIAYIAQKGNLTPRDKPRGPRCGQCEDRKAAVTCQQCAEDYCAGCFAAFHLKGNLKKHRSVPLMATPRQCFASPRPSHSTTSSYDFDHGDGAMVSQNLNSARKDRNSPEGASGQVENNLLYGEYNEAEQAASFQDALDAWRKGKGESAGDQSGRDRNHSNHTPRGVPYSPVQTPTVNVDSGVGTVNKPQEIEITFNTNTISYADRLLLKKHRRTDVETLFTPRDGSESQRATPRYDTRGPYREGSSASIKIEDFNEQDFAADEERVDFQSLYSTVKEDQTDPMEEPRPESVVSIVEVQDSQSDFGLERLGKYKVAEEGGMERWATELQQTSPSKPLPPKSGKSSRRKSGKKSTRSSVENSLVSEDSILSKPSLLAREETTSDINSILNSRLLGAKLNDIENEFKHTDLKSGRGSNKESKNKENFASSKSANSARLPPKSASKQKQAQQDAKVQQGSTAKNLSKDVVSENKKGSAIEVTKGSVKGSVASRPQSASRPTSRQNQNQSQSRPGTSKGSRPSSRTNSRMGSRASSRADNPGLLTKAPSDSLQSVARMTPTGDTYRGIDSFFMVGVEPEQQEERTLTPTQSRKGSSNKEEKIKVSYQLYNMAPRSWKPDFSIADSVPVDDVEDEEAENDRANSVMAYHAYSEQVMSDITERLISRFDELPLDEDSMSDHSSGSAYRSLGEEFRTFTPRCTSHGSSVQNSPTPIPSARNGVQREASNVSRGSVSTSQTLKSTRHSTGSPSSPHPPRSQRVTQTPRQSGQALTRSKTPQLSRSRLGIQTPRRSKTTHEDLDRPVSRMIVMEGTDLSIYDAVGEKEKCNAEDEETLDQLEYELASQSGRVTADGKISRMEMPEDLSDDSIDDSLESFRSMSRIGHDHGIDINSKLRKDELEEDEDATDDESDVRNLM